MVGSSGGGETGQTGSFEEANSNGGGDQKPPGSGHSVVSLGHALAGVSLGGRSSPTVVSSDNSFFVPSGSANSGARAATDSSPGGRGWGTFTDVGTTDPSAFGSAGGSGGGGGGPSKGDSSRSTAANGSLELFLSRDPSQTLGENVLLKLSSHNLHGMGGSEQDAATTGEGKTGASQQLRSTNVAESPQSVTATGTTAASSQSGSPSYHHHNSSNTNVTMNHNGIDPNNNPNHQYHHTIEPFQQAFATPASGPSDYSAFGGVSSFPPPSSPAYHAGVSSPYTKNINGGPKFTTTSAYAPPLALYDNAFTTSGGGMMSPQDSSMNAPAGAPGQQQVLYMAVPSPDGRGQVLQPVQMVPLPGSKQMAYVVAGPAGALPEQPLIDPYGTSGGNLGGPSVIGTPPDLRSNAPNSIMNGGYGASNDASFMSSRSPYSEPRIGGGDDYSLNGGGNNGGSPFHSTDPTIASLYASPQRPPLHALLGQVRRLSRDQVGCRLVQQALDEEGPMAASLILQEGLSFWGEAMVDPFGNYLFQKILEKVTPEERILLVKSVSTRLVNASLNLHGTRSVQKVVELCAADEAVSPQGEDSAADILTQALTPAAARLCIDSHGNHVIQRIILKLGPKHAEFVFDAVAASVGDVARHRHGCCVIQRCLDSPPSEARSHLVRCIIEKALELMQDAYGNYVVQYVLDVCSDEDVHAVCESVVGKVNLLAIQKFSSNVMEKCLERCSERVKECYMVEMSDPDRIRELMMDPFGNYVVQRALSVATHAQAIRLVEAMRPHLMASTTATGSMLRNGGVRNTAGGRRIIAKICRRFPNFTLNPPGSEPQPQGHQDLYRRGAAHSHFPQGQHHHGHQHHHTGGGSHQLHDELYSRNKNRYHHDQSLQQSLPPPQQQQHPLLAPNLFAVAPPTQPQDQHLLWKSTEQDQRGYVAPPPASSPSASVSYYNPLGGPSYYDPFGGGLGGGGGFHGAF